MAASKLSIYNAALGHLGERKLASLTEAREPRRVLDDFYPDVQAYCLEKSTWEFACRLVQIDASTSVTPPFGFTNAFVKPTDWVRTVLISGSETFDPPLAAYQEERGYWYADCDPLYVRYVSNHASLGGGDLSRWTQAFEDYVAYELAYRACLRISGAETRRGELRKEARKALSAARGIDTTSEAPQFSPAGSWVTSRGGNSNRSRWDRTFR